MMMNIQNAQLTYKNFIGLFSSKDIGSLISYFSSKELSILKLSNQKLYYLIKSAWENTLWKNSCMLDYPLTTLKIFKDILYIGSSNQTIKVRSLADQKHLHTLRGHQAAISCLLPFKGDGLLSGDQNGVVKLWKGNQEQPSWKAASTRIVALQKINSLVAFASTHSIKIYSIESHRSLQSWTMQEAILDLHWDRQKLLSLHERNIKVWNADHHRCLKVIEFQDFLQPEKFICVKNHIVACNSYYQVSIQLDFPPKPSSLSGKIQDAVLHILNEINPFWTIRLTNA
jgi:hypothetical protein